MRPEQADAVQRTAAYFLEHADDPHPPRFLWNAKMRFGKTFTAYQLARRVGWKRVLVLTTSRPYATRGVTIWPATSTSRTGSSPTATPRAIQTRLLQSFGSRPSRTCSVRLPTAG